MVGQGSAQSDLSDGFSSSRSEPLLQKKISVFDVAIPTATMCIMSSGQSSLKKAEWLG